MRQQWKLVLLHGSFHNCRPGSVIPIITVTILDPNGTWKGVLERRFKKVVATGNLPTSPDEKDLFVSSAYGVKVYEPLKGSCPTALLYTPFQICFVTMSMTARNQNH